MRRRHDSILEKGPIQLAKETNTFWLASRGIWAESYAPWHGALFGLLEPVNAASALFGLGIYTDMAVDAPVHLRSLGLHAVTAINLISSCYAHASANALACWADRRSLLWATSWELAFIIHRAAARAELHMASAVGLVLLGSWCVPVELGFACGLFVAEYVHYNGLDASSGASVADLELISEHAAAGARLILLASCFWLFDRLSHIWPVCGHAFWHVICAAGCGRLTTAIALSHTT